MALISAVQMTPMQTENYASTNIRIERPGSEKGCVSKLARVRVTIRSFYEKLLRSFRSVLKYLKTKLNKREEENI